MFIILPVTLISGQDEVNTVNTPPVVTTSTQIESDINTYAVSQRDVEDITINNGAKVRVFQLQRSVYTNIVGAENIISNLRELYIKDIDYDKLYSIVNSLEAILIDLEEFDYDRPHQEMARDFLIHKSDAVALTSKFREYVSSFITNEQREKLRQIYNNSREEVREEYSKRIKEEVKNQNIVHLRNLLNRYNLNTEFIIEQLENGEITIEQVRERLSMLSSNVTSQQRIEISQRALENRNRQNIEVRERVQEFQEELKEESQIRSERINKRVEKRAQVIESRIVDRSTPTIIKNLSSEENQQKIAEERRRIEAVRNERLERLNERGEVKDDNLIACTREYAPVCAQPPMPKCSTDLGCPQVMPDLKTYGNSCMARAAGAEIISRGECENQEDEIIKHRGGGFGKVSIGDITFTRKDSTSIRNTVESEGKVNLMFDEQRYILVEGDKETLSFLNTFLKIEGIKGESIELKIDEKGYLIVNERIDSRTELFLELVNVDKIATILIENDIRNNNFGRIKVLELHTSKNQSEEKCEIRHEEIEVLSWCWGGI